MPSWIPNALLTFERVSVTLAAILAIFPLYTYYAEAPDRQRERLVQEAQMIVHCSQFASFDRAMKIDQMINDLRQLVHPVGSDIEALAKDKEFKLVVACYDLGLGSSHRKDWKNIRAELKGYRLIED